VRELPQSFRELVDVIQFTEQVSAKLHGILDEDEIFDTVVDEFRGSGKYIVAILLLSDDPSRLLIRGISLPVKLLRMAEKATGLKIADFEIELGRSEAYSQVIEGGETIEGVIVGEVIAQVVPRPVALVATRILGVSNKMHILTPLRRQGRIIGLIGMDSTTLGKHLIPSVKNLALHISGALDLATEISRRRLAEETLRDSEEKFRLVTENVPDHLMLLDRDANILFINHTLTDLTREQVLGTSFHDYALEEFRPVAQKCFDSVLATGEPSSWESTYESKEGGPKYFESFVGPVTEKGEVVGLVVRSAEVTAQRKTEEELSSERGLLRTLIDNMPDYIYVKDPESRFLTANVAHLEALGVESVGAVFGKTDFDFHPPELAKRYYQDEQEVMKTRRPLIGREEPVKDKSGRARWFLTTKVPVVGADGEVLGIVGIGRDITQRRRAEEALQAHTEQLEDLVRERTRELREKQRLATIGETTTMVGHDLRNPLQAILNNLYLAKKKLARSSLTCRTLPDRSCPSDT
jgi:PAS domain S-box-containing protein